jgi:hypothetical protein
MLQQGEQMGNNSDLNACKWRAYSRRLASIDELEFDGQTWHNAEVSGQGDKRYVRDIEAATFLGVRVGTLRSWRSKMPPCGPPVTRMGKMVMYSVKGLEQYMEERTVGGR